MCINCYSISTSLVNGISKFQPTFTFFINCQSLEVIVQCISSINTMSGTRRFVIAVAFDVEPLEVRTRRCAISTLQALGKMVIVRSIAFRYGVTIRTYMRVRF